MESSSTIRITKQTKMVRLSALMALQIAKQSGDPLYKRFSKFRKLYRAIKFQLVKKYIGKGRIAARAAIAKKSKEKENESTKTK